MLTICAADQLPLQHSFSDELAVVVFGCVLEEETDSAPSRLIFVAMVMRANGDHDQGPHTFAAVQNTTFVTQQDVAFVVPSLSARPCTLAVGIVTRVSCPAARPLNASLSLAITAGSHRAWLANVRLERSQLDGAQQRRSLVWVATPLFEPSGREDPLPLSSARADAWTRARQWAAAWQAAGFAHVHVLARSTDICAAFLQRAPAGCMCSVQAIEHRAYTTRHKLHKDQIAYNNLGLAFAQAARYAAVAFVDVDERPGNFGLARAVDHELRHKQLPFLLAYMRVSQCAACPTPATVQHSCHPGVLELGGATKPIAVPHRVQWVSVHYVTAKPTSKGGAPEAQEASVRLGLRPASWAWSTCLLHPIPIMRGKYERSAARDRWWGGNASTGWRDGPPLEWLTEFERGGVERDDDT